MRTYVATGEVTALKHELRDDTVELAALVAEALLAGAERTEVLGGLGDDVVEELKVDAARALCWISLDPTRAFDSPCEDVRNLPLISLSVLVTLPEASTVAWGPSQVQSKKTFMTMLADDAWKERAKVGWLKDLLRSEAVMEGLLDRNRAAVDVEREENILLAEEGQFLERGAAAAPL